jgi:hypothetical protein
VAIAPVLSNFASSTSSETPWWSALFARLGARRDRFNG